MANVRVEIFRIGSKGKRYPGVVMDQKPLQTAVETSGASATTAGSRIQVAPTGVADNSFVARITSDGTVYMDVGVNPTAVTAPASGMWRILAGLPLEIPVSRGDLFSFIN